MTVTHDEIFRRLQSETPIVVPHRVTWFGDGTNVVWLPGEERQCDDHATDKMHRPGCTMCAVKAGRWAALYRDEHRRIRQRWLNEDEWEWEWEEDTVTVECRACGADMPRDSTSVDIGADDEIYYQCIDVESCGARSATRVNDALDPAAEGYLVEIVADLQQRLAAVEEEGAWSRNGYVLNELQELRQRVTKLEAYRETQPAPPLSPWPYPQEEPLSLKAVDEVVDPPATFNGGMLMPGPPARPLGPLDDPLVTLMQADARKLPLEDGSVDLIVTSPPYWAQRSYTDGGGQHYDGQIGDEPTFEEYLDKMIACTREWMRVVKPTGSIWVNLGDKYSTRTTGTSDAEEQRDHVGAGRSPNARSGTRGVPEKSLVGLPWRYALRCIDELGLILRAEVIWSKPNGMPESVTDRVRRSHEQWFHFTRSGRYYSAVDRVRDEYAPETAKRYKSGYGPTKRGDAGAVSSPAILGYSAGDGGPSEVNPLGKLPPSVWEIPTQPLLVPPELGVDHFAAFPMEFPRRIIQGWSPQAICTACGEGRRPVKTVRREGGRIRKQADTRFLGKPKADGSMPGGQDAPGAHAGYTTVHTISGEACACTPYVDHPGVRVGVEARTSEALVPGNTPRSLGAQAQGPWREYLFDGWEPPPTEPGVVLDPFGGTGTTALVASVLGRHGITNDMSQDYLSIAEWRTHDPAQRAAALEVPKPPAQMPGQMDLFTQQEAAS